MAPVSCLVKSHQRLSLLPRNAPGFSGISRKARWVLGRIQFVLGAKKGAVAHYRFLAVREAGPPSGIHVFWQRPPLAIGLVPGLRPQVGFPRLVRSFQNPAQARPDDQCVSFAGQGWRARNAIIRAYPTSEAAGEKKYDRLGVVGWGLLGLCPARALRAHANEESGG
jgi:hypothetical protein